MQSVNTSHFISRHYLGNVSRYKRDNVHARRNRGLYVIVALIFHNNYRAEEDRRCKSLLSTHSFVQEQLVSREVVGAQQAAEDPDGGLKKVHVYVLVEGELVLYPGPRFLKL